MDKKRMPNTALVWVIVVAAFLFSFVALFTAVDSIRATTRLNQQADAMLRYYDDESEPTPVHDQLLRLMEGQVKIPGVVKPVSCDGRQETVIVSPEHWVDQ